MSGDRVFVAVCSLTVSIGLTAIGAFGLAAWAFGSATTIRLPLVATFHGFEEKDGTHAVTIDASWMGVTVVILVLAAPLLAAVVTRCGRPAD
ncbi:hypothetical protein [Microbacterium testaceum]|uniref:hypothetical protein n=1 Tax=Microbacterium testaceum TaxID=2033 RepID=UPI0012444F0C|nr:hypothetical protein [Microbacterium testaceum]